MFITVDFKTRVSAVCGVVLSPKWKLEARNSPTSEGIIACCIEFVYGG